MRAEEFRIIKQCIKGDADAYAILVERYKDMAYNVAYRMVGDHDTSTDIAQESFIAAYVALKDYKNDSKFSSWLCSIVMNKARDFLSSKKNNVSIDDIAELCASKTPSPEEIVSKKQLARDIQTVLNLIPTEYREAIVLKHIEGLDYKEMETILGVSANTLKVRTHRGREMMKEILKERGGFHE